MQFCFVKSKAYVSIQTLNCLPTGQLRPTRDISQRHHFQQPHNCNYKSEVGDNLDRTRRNGKEKKGQMSLSVPAGGPPRWPLLGVAVMPGLGVQGWEAGRTPEVGCGLPCLPHSHHWRGSPATKTVIKRDVQRAPQNILWFIIYQPKWVWANSPHVVCHQSIVMWNDIYVCQWLMFNCLYVLIIWASTE